MAWRWTSGERPSRFCNKIHKLFLHIYMRFKRGSLQWFVDRIIYLKVIWPKFKRQDDAELRYGVGRSDGVTKGISLGLFCFGVENEVNGAWRWPLELWPFRLRMS